MRVGVDGRSLAGPAGRGIAHYTAGLLTALAAARPAAELRVFVPGRDRSPLLDGLARPGLSVRRHPLPSRALFGGAALVGRPRLDRLLGGGLDVVWAPAPAPLAVSPAVPLALTVHDLSFEQRPGDFTPYERAWHRAGRLGRLARRARVVLTDTAAVRDEVVLAWGVGRERITVVPPGVEAPAVPGEDRVAAARRRHGLPSRYLLFVGALEPRKAPDVLLDAFARARARGLDAGLVLVGDGRLAPALEARAVPGVRLLGRASGADRDALYAGALALVLPSWLEGFGLPPLEALVLGTPAVVSDLPVLRETLGPDGARFVAPGDPAGLATALLDVARDERLRARLATAGGTAAARFTWRRAAEQAWAAFEEAAA